jgi:hypothetical protein
MKPQGNNILAGTSLAIAQIQSPDYVPGVSGWIIRQDGSAEFNTGTFRGDITITQADGTILVISDEFIQFFASDGTTALGVIGVLDPTAGGLSISGQDGAAAASLYLVPGGGGALVASAPIAANKPGAAAGTPETWHAMSPLLNSWANSAGNVAPQYRKVASPPNSVEIIGTLNAAAATATTFFTLPANYIPASVQAIPCGTFNASAGIDNVPFIQCDASGNLTVQQRIASATGIRFHGFISLDA